MVTMIPVSVRMFLRQRHVLLVLSGAAMARWWHEVGAALRGRRGAGLRVGSALRGGHPHGLVDARRYTLLRKPQHLALSFVRCCPWQIVYDGARPRDPVVGSARMEAMGTTWGVPGVRTHPIESCRDSILMGLLHCGHVCVWAHD